MARSILDRQAIRSVSFFKSLERMAVRLSDRYSYGKAITNAVGAVFESGVNVVFCSTAFCTLVY